MLPIQKKITSHNKRWNIQLDPREEFVKFKNRLLSAIDSSVGQFIIDNGDVSVTYALQMGYPQPDRSGTSSALLAQKINSISLLGWTFSQTMVCVKIKEAKTEKELINFLQHLFWVLIDYKCPNIDELITSIRAASEISTNVNFNIVKRGDSIILCPIGAKLLDNAVINEDLDWLIDYPSVYKHFENALKIYQRKDITFYRNLLDELRCAMEKLVRIILGNKIPIEKQKKPLLKWMEEKDVHVQVRNAFEFLLFQFFVRYQNDAVKHGEGWAENEVEFMIYLTGTFMRLLLQLNGRNKG